MFQTHHPADLEAHEHCALMRLYADTQSRCSSLISDQHAEIQMLQTRLLQMQARAIIQLTALAWEREAHMALQIQYTHLLNMHRWAPHSADPIGAPPDLPTLSQRATQLLICQTGCVTHDDHWRSNDQCQRSGKPCLLVQQPDALEMLHSATAPSPLPSP